MRYVLLGQKKDLDTQAKGNMKSNGYVSSHRPESERVIEGLVKSAYVNQLRLTKKTEIKVVDVHGETPIPHSLVEPMLKEIGEILDLEITPPPYVVGKTRIKTFVGHITANQCSFKRREGSEN